MVHSFSSSAFPSLPGCTPDTSSPWDITGAAVWELGAHTRQECAGTGTRHSRGEGQEHPQALPPAQIALPPTSSDENLSWAGLGGAEASLAL